ncbi:uncharacterized protein ASPGLDRAFT_416574 [Aspergillus glaucus CBS 516.65]|uniref:Uncharacterized protein n=1 Tax=Aspergillus glaucus CBS 516.65 TaxID=1160497 RepID=A0A1L9VI57_ASPGL|nr:hypothetical protein ASPGLDRAFT_416574 [Aspergillus glaucus CBS 516.65]OJJ83594.1 hypothetical protein ASPGLDRAFT_416574 [Aspergillus glaucus CBS 516.65]
MQLSTILTFTVALLAGHALASPELQKRTTCQACSVAGVEGGAACCSAHVCFHRHEHVDGRILTDVNSAFPRVTSTVVTAIARITASATRCLIGKLMNRQPGGGS